MPKLRPVPNLQNLCVEEITRYIVSLPETIIENSHHRCIPKAYLKELNELLATSVCSSLLNTIAEKVIQSLIRRISEISKELRENAFTTSIASIVEVVLNPSLKKWVNNCKCDEIRSIVDSSLLKLNGIEYLSIEYLRCSDGNYTDYKESYIVSAVSKMHHLRYFHYNDCTNAIIAKIAEHCPEISTIIVDFSPDLDDLAVPSLIKCTKLKKLSLERTLLSKTGIAELLFGLPNLEGISLSMEQDDFDELVKSIKNNENWTNKPFALKSLSLCKYFESYIDLVAMFPKLEELSIENYKNDFVDLCNLEHLNNFSLVGSEGCPIKFLNIRGAHLTSLEIFENDYETVSFDLIMNIGEYCQQLKSFVISSGIYDETEIQNLRKSSVLQFQKLETLKMSFAYFGSCDIHHFEYLLKNTFNIKHLEFVDVPIRHEWIVRILALNPMNRLKNLNIEFPKDSDRKNSDLQMKTVNLLIENCTDLRRFENIDSWVDLMEYKNLKKWIKSNNYDLKV